MIPLRRAVKSLPFVFWTLFLVVVLSILLFLKLSGGNIEQDDIVGFTAHVTADGDPQSIQISGRIFGPILVFKDIKSDVEDHVMVIRARATFAGNPFGTNSSSFNVNVAVPKGVEEIRFGQHRNLLWKRSGEKGTNRPN